MNKLATIALLALSGLLAGCSGMSMRNMSTSGGAGTETMTSSGSPRFPGANSWYNNRQDISRGIYFGG